jgi:hypothetical protein
MHELMLERERQALEALKKCACAGVDHETLATLARECGITNWEPDAHAATASVGR